MFWNRHDKTLIIQATINVRSNWKKNWNVSRLSHSCCKSKMSILKRSTILTEIRSQMRIEVVSRCLNFRPGAHNIIQRTKMQCSCINEGICCAHVIVKKRWTTHTHIVHSSSQNAQNTTQYMAQHSTPTAVYTYYTLFKTADVCVDKGAQDAWMT